LLLDLFDPSSNLAHGYTVYSVVTTAGRVYTGLLAAETATSISLRIAPESSTASDQPVAETILLRKDIEEMRASTKSLMPDGLEKDLGTQDVADLLGYLREALGPVVPPGIVLFDDDPEFLNGLISGGAVATLSEDAFSGKSSLHLTAGQRHSPRLPGWQFAIVEQPAAHASEPANSDRRNGQPLTRFRYLRFAWKSLGAEGVMLELAADGAWPPADQPIRRYYSGKNSSGWQAIEVSPNTPTEWTVVTIDLWKDCGPFTLTGIAPTALRGEALFDRIELLETLESPRK